MSSLPSSPSLTPPIDLSHHFSYTTKRRENSNVKGLYKYFFIPGIANLAGGLPNASFFPYDTLEASIARPHRFHPTPQSGPAQPKRAQPTSRLAIPKESQTTNLTKKIDLTTALQYGTAEGLPSMASFVHLFTRHHLHPNIPYAKGPDTILTCGSTDGFAKVIETFSNTWDADRDWDRDRQGLLCEEFVYMNAIQAVRPRGLNIVPVAVDAEGMVPHGRGGLADVLANWDYRRGKRPHLMYTITIGQNPTGGTLSVLRRKELYAICQKYDIVIIEDDPYWNLQYHDSSPSDTTDPKLTRTRNYNAHGKSSGYDFLDSLVPSYLSVDVDGRVVRLDTFSKTIAPGCRLGWITAQPAVVERIARITEATTQQPSGFVQAMVAELILGQQADDNELPSSKEVDSGWKMDGWVRWLEGLRGAYERRMQEMCGILEEGKYLLNIDIDTEDTQLLPSSEDEPDLTWEVLDRIQIYDFAWPTAGMFVWVQVCFETHPLIRIYSPEKLSKALWVYLTRKPYLCLLGPGSLFAPTPEVMSKAYRYFRLCFAALPAEEVGDVTRRLVAGLRTFWQRNDLSGLDGEEEEVGL